MSAIQAVVALIDERGSGTVDDLMPALGEVTRITRTQAIKALQNAALYGLIKCDGRGPRLAKGWRGSKPATYRAIKKTYRPRVASVWDLAQVSA